MYKASELMKMEFLIVIATKVGRRCGRGGKTALLIHIQAIYVQGRRGNEKHIFHRYSHENGEYKGTAFQSINCGYVLFSVMLSMETRISVLRSRHLNEVKQSKCAKHYLFFACFHQKRSKMHD